MRRDNPRGIPQARIDHRRMLVARLTLAGLSTREVGRALAHDLVNPDTDQPYDHMTISRDVKHLTNAWRLSAAADHAEHQGRILAELREVVRRAASGIPDLNAWLRSLAQQAKLLGVDAPVSVEQGGEILIRVKYADDVHGFDAAPAPSEPEASVD